MRSRALSLPSNLERVHVCIIINHLAIDFARLIENKREERRGES